MRPSLPSLRADLSALQAGMRARESRAAELRARTASKRAFLSQHAAAQGSPSPPGGPAGAPAADHVAGHSPSDAHHLAMRRGVTSLQDLDAFLRSGAARDLVHFVGALARVVAGGHVHVMAGAGVLDEHVFLPLHGVLERTPPEGAGHGERFGNRAFRTWHAQLVDASEDMAKRVLGTEGDAAAVTEFATYLAGSFGDPTRLDFGTGHEAAFIMLMCALSKRAGGTVADDNHLRFLALGVFPAYMRLVRRIRKTYRLEPAGSHGVWSLDDYHFLPFILGSAQFMGVTSPAPRDVLRFSNPNEFLAKRGLVFPADNLLVEAVVDILDSKRGPFNEHSPMLYELGSFKSWEEVNTGLLRMWKGEVLSKFPVAQHFWFGPTLPVTWELTPPPPQQHQQQPQMHTIMSAGPVPAAFDPLSKYFHRSSQQAQQPHSASTEGVDYALLDNGAGIVVRPGGAASWILSSVADSKIANEAEQEAMRVQSNGVLDFPLPEMVFGRNAFSIVNEASGFSYRVDAASALLGVKLGPGPPDRRMLKVKMAEKWANRSDADGNVIKTWREDFDWTFTTHYGGEFETRNPKTGEAMQGPAALKVTPRRIDYERLKLREPILWNRQVLFFEDDLFDMGLSKFMLKVRVMPSCFLVLTRLFVRIDGMFFRAFDTRVFHVFGTKVVLVEVSKREADFQEHLHAGFKAEDSDALVQALPLVEPAKTFEVSC